MVYIEKDEVTNINKVIVSLTCNKLCVVCIEHLRFRELWCYSCLPRSLSEALFIIEFANFGSYSFIECGQTNR